MQDQRSSQPLTLTQPDSATNVAPSERPEIAVGSHVAADTRERDETFFFTARLANDQLQAVSRDGVRDTAPVPGEATAIVTPEPQEMVASGREGDRRRRWKLQCVRVMEMGV